LRNSVRKYGLNTHEKSIIPSIHVIELLELRVAIVGNNVAFPIGPPEAPKEHM